MLLLGLHNVLLSKWTCFVQDFKVAPLHVVIVLVPLSTNFQSFFQDNRGGRSLAERHVCSGAVTRFSRGGAHLFTHTSVLPTWGPGSSALPLSPWI